MEVKLILSFHDRIGLMADISAVMAKNGINVSAIEAFVGETVEIFVTMENPGDNFNVERIISQLKMLEGFIKARLSKASPADERLRLYKVLLDNVSDGILVIDVNGIVTAVNRVAKEKFFMAQSQMTGHHIDDFTIPNPLLYRSLHGETFVDEPRSITNRNGTFEYLATVKAVYDAEGKLEGAVEIMKNLQEVKILTDRVPPSETVTFADCISISPIIDSSVSFAKKIAKTESIVNIQGESGTGKDLFARAIHFESGRKGPFIPVNCAALPENLLESELFGYKGGAFTGASKDGRAGLFEVARGGTIFLDEIGEMPLGPQAKILRVIQDRRVRRVGDQNEIAVDVRIISATNQKMEDMVRSGSFREDLFYRINVMPIYLPPLRERLEDVGLLAKVFLDEFCNRMKATPKVLSKQALEKLLRHDWPGNIRELKNVIERAAILCDGKVISDDYIVYGHGGQARTSLPEGFAHGVMREDMESFKDTMARYERNLLISALAEGNSVRRTAKKLQISHTALLNKIKAYGLDVKN